MIRGIVRWSLAFRFAVLVVAAAVMVLGVLQLGNMPVDVLPEFSPPSVEIQTEALGLSAQEVEQLITVPMEQDLLNGVPWLRTIHSESVAGISSIVLVFQPGTDLMRGRQMVAERLTQAVALPHVSRPPTMLQPLSSTSRVLMVGLSSKTLSLIQMSVLARWTIAPRLMSVPGVANVAIWGQRDRQLQVQVDPKRLRDNNVPLTRVLETTANALWVSTLSFVEASTPGTGGFIDTANQRLGVRHILPIVSPEGLAQVPIEDTSLRLSDVARVVEDNQPLIGDAITNDGPGLLLVVEKFPGANTLEVTRGLEEALDNMGPGLSGMKTDSTLFRPADFIQTAMNNVPLALLIGLILVMMVLAAFLFQWRTILISLVAIPMSLLVGVFVLHLRGATMNALALAGLAMALGIVIDDAVVDVENIARRLRQHRAEGSAKPIARIMLEASYEVRAVTVYATLIMLIAVLPVFFIGGASGAFFQPLALSYGLAILASLIVALTVTPALCLLLLAKAPAERREPPLASWLQSGYARWLERIVRRPRAVFAAVGLMLVAGLAVLPLLGLSLLPDFKPRDLLVHLGVAPGASQPEVSRIAGRISQEVRSIPGVRNVGAQVGRAVLGDQVVNVSSAELWINIDPAADYDRTTAAIQKVLDGYPGVHNDLHTYLNEISSEVVPPPSNSIVVRVFGDTTDGLRSQADAVQKAITGISGIMGIRANLPVQQPTFEIEVDLAAAQRYGIKPGDVRRASATMLSGIQVGNLFEEQKIFGVVVWSAPETRSSLSSIRNLLVDTPSGGQVRLGDVAQVRVVPAESVIRHEDVRRYLDVVATVEGRNLGAVAADIQSRLKQVQFPLEYHAEVLGDYAQRQADQTRLLVLAIAAVIAAFFLLQAAFGSWRMAAALLVTLPSALVGGLLTTLVAGGGVSVGTLAGLLMVLGAAVRNGILLINHYQNLERDESAPFGLGLILRGAHERVSPILMTALATGLAFVPALVLGDVPGLEILRPMAAAVLGGLVTSTLFGLFVVPALCWRLAIRPAQELELVPLTITSATEVTIGTAMEVPGLSGGD